MKRIKFNLLFLFLIVFSLLVDSQYEVKAATYGDEFITNFQITNLAGTAVLGDGTIVKIYDQYKANYEFKLPDNTLKENDTMVIDLP